MKPVHMQLKPWKLLHRLSTSLTTEIVITDETSTDGFWIKTLTDANLANRDPASRQLFRRSQTGSAVVEFLPDRGTDAESVIIRDPGAFIDLWRARDLGFAGPAIMHLVRYATRRQPRKDRVTGRVSYHPDGDYAPTPGSKWFMQLIRDRMR